ncbi:MAG: hypothetical protein ACJ0SL_02235 [Candidatus Rariloculaceae bacterium]
MPPWYDWKGGVAERSGLTVGVNASLLYQHASDALGSEDHAAGGVYRIQGEWGLFSSE